MRRFLALATLFVLSLSRFGAPAPVHARAWSAAPASPELVATTASVRLVALAVRDLGPRAQSRAPLPWLPFRPERPLGVSSPVVRTADAIPAAPRASAGVWHRFTYDATAPPLHS